MEQKVSMNVYTQKAVADWRVVVTPRENLAGAAETEEVVAAPETPTGGEVSVRDTWRNFWQLLKLRSAGRLTRTRCFAHKTS